MIVSLLMISSQLASMGINVVLISRSPSKLEATAHQLSKSLLILFFRVFQYSCRSTNEFSPLMYRKHQPLYPSTNCCSRLYGCANYYSIITLMRLKWTFLIWKGDKSLYKEIAISLSDLDIGILINNVGQCLGFCSPFASIQDDRILDNLINW